jgi:hypothetical protein
MKNKLFLSLAMLVAGNAFIATPAMAIDWTTAKVVGKTALGVTAFGTSVFVPFVYGAGLHAALNEARQKKQSPLKHLLSTTINDPQTAVTTAVVCSISVISSVIGYKALISALNDFQNIKK